MSPSSTKRTFSFSSAAGSIMIGLCNMPWCDYLARQTPQNWTFALNSALQYPLHFLTNPISVQHYKDSLTSLFHFQSSRAVGSIGTNWDSAVGQDDNGLDRVRGKRLGQSSWRRFLSKRWFLYLWCPSFHLWFSLSLESGDLGNIQSLVMDTPVKC